MFRFMQFLQAVGIGAVVFCFVLQREKISAEGLIGFGIGKFLQKDKQLITELLFKRQLHTKLSGPTYKTLVYAFAKAYHERTDVQVLKEYTSALMGRYEYGYDCFAKIIQQKELALINYIIDNIKVTDICSDKRTQVFMRQAMTLLILTSDMKYDKETELVIDRLLDEFKEGRAQM